MGFYLDVSLCELPLSSFLITKFYVSINIILLWSIQRFLLVETHLQMETGHLLSSADPIYWFLYVAPLQKVFQITDKNNLLITHNDSVNTLQFFFTYPSTTWVESDEKICILHFIISVFVFFVLLFLICLTKFESIELKSYITILLFTIAVNMPFLEFSSRKGFSFNYTINAG